MRTIILLFAAAQALAKSITFVDTFDNNGGVVASASPVQGTAGGALYYNAFNYADATGQTTVTPASAPNTITYGTTAQLREGQPRWRPINSTIKCFDQKSIYYACVSDTQAVGAAITCTIQLAGVSALTGITVVQELLYDSSVAGPMAYATFPALTFSCLSSISVQVLQSPISQLLTSPLFDNNTYTAYYY